MTNTELEIMLDAATYLGAHSQPPPNGTDAAVDWWMDAAADIGAIAAKWGNHPLATTILIAIYGYLEEKTKAVTPCTDTRHWPMASLSRQ